MRGRIVQKEKKKSNHPDPELYMVLAAGASVLQQLVEDAGLF